MIVQLEEAKTKLNGLITDTKELKSALNVDELAERAASKLGCCVCAVCGIHFDGISRAEIASVVAAVRDMADTWLGSASHH